MLKNMKKKNIKMMMWAFAFLLLAGCGLASCSDSDSSGSGTPVITGVRSCDPDLADSLFTKASPGQIIAIIGENLSGVLEVYINDQLVSFNSTMNTDHSVIVTIPSTDDGFLLSAYNSDLSDEIRVVTSHGTATYSFKVITGAPTIIRTQAAYPRETGDTMTVYGFNLVDIERVYFTSMTTDEIAELESGEEIGGTQVDVTDYWLNEQTSSADTSKVGMVIPELPFETGTLVIVTSAGTTYTPFYSVPGVPTITAVSSEFPEIGETVTITGTEFVQLESIKYGDVTISGDDITVDDTEQSLTFVFNTKPTQGSGTTLTLTTPGGTATFDNFFNYDFLMVDFEDRGIDNAWSPNANYITPSGKSAPYTSDGKVARIKVTESQQWWGTMIYFRNSWNNGGYDPFVLPGYDVIPADASTDDVYLAVEVYDNNCDYNAVDEETGLETFGGYIRYFIQKNAEDPVENSNQYDNFAWLDYDAGTFEHPVKVLADIDGNAYKGKWYRHVVPLSSFGMYKGLTYKDVYEGGINQIRLQSINQSTTKGSVWVYFDNIRLYYNK